MMPFVRGTLNLRTYWSERANVTSTCFTSKGRAIRDSSVDTQYGARVVCSHWQLQTMSKWEADSAVMDAMSDLERVQWVARMDDGSRGATVTWAINPRLISQFQSQRDQVIAARQARRNEIYEEYQKVDPNHRPKPVYGYDKDRHGD